MMKKGLIILFGTFMGVVLVQSASFAEEGFDQIVDLTKGEDGKTILEEYNALPLIFKGVARKGFAGAAGPVVIHEKRVSKKELEEALKEAALKEAEARHFMQRKGVVPPQKPRGTVVQGSPLGQKYDSLRQTGTSLFDLRRKR